MSTEENLMDYYLHEVWQKYADPRTGEWPLLYGGPWKLLGIISCYVIIVKVLGPKWMKSRDPLNIRPLLMVYNSLLIAINFTATFLCLSATNWGLNLFNCQRVNPKTATFQDTALLHFSYIYLWVRVLELSETFFYVLRKRFSYASFLHLFHHSAVPLVGYALLKYHPGNNAYYFPWSNCVVHSIMYSYYAMACSGQEMSRFCWWKKHMTQVQLVQFVTVMLNSLACLLLPGSDFPVPVALLTFSVSSMFLILFTQFYRETYLQKGKSS